MWRVGRRPIIGHWLRPVDRVRLNLLACGSERLRAEIRAHILPDDLTVGRDLEKEAVHTLVDEGVAVGQAAGIADERAVKGPFGASLSLPVYSQTICCFTGSISSAREPGKTLSVRTKTKSPQTNGICERFHRTVLDELYRVAFCQKNLPLD